MAATMAPLGLLTIMLYQLLHIGFGFYIHSVSDMQRNTRSEDGPDICTGSPFAQNICLFCDALGMRNGIQCCTDQATYDGCTAVTDWFLQMYTDQPSTFYPSIQNSEVKRSQHDDHQGYRALFDVARRSLESLSDVQDDTLPGAQYKSKVRFQKNVKIVNERPMS